MAGSFRLCEGSSWCYCLATRQLWGFSSQELCPRAENLRNIGLLIYAYSGLVCLPRIAAYEMSGPAIIEISSDSDEDENRTATPWFQAAVEVIEVIEISDDSGGSETEKPGASSSNYGRYSQPSVTQARRGISVENEYRTQERHIAQTKVLEPVGLTKELSVTLQCPLLRNQNNVAMSTLQSSLLDEGPCDKGRELDTLLFSEEGIKPGQEDISFARRLSIIRGRSVGRKKCDRSKFCVQYFVSFQFYISFR